MNYHLQTAFAIAAAGIIAGAGHASAGTETQTQGASMHKEYFENFQITSVNREAMHAPIYGTFYDEASAAAFRKKPSLYTMSLNGQWKFQLYSKPGDAPSGFMNPDFNDAGWRDMTVPSNWQMDMSLPDRAIYTRDVYLFNANPPNVPEANPTGCYRRTFDVPEEWLKRDIRIVFEGVDSAYLVWINGKEAGYAEDSRLPSEFAITKWLKPGKNTIAVKVYRFSTGTFMECQDTWHMSGIYRGVSLMALSPVHLRDWRITTTFDRDYRDAVLDVSAYLETRALPPQPVGTSASTWYPGYRVKARLVDAEGNLVAESNPERFCGQTSMYGGQSERDAAMFKMNIKAPKQWSPDTPYLYKLFLHLVDDSGKTLEVQYVPVGFRQVEIKNRQLLLNGKLMFIRGVNRHEFSAKHAHAVTEEEMRLDLETMKKLNFNSIRTCHYPDNNLWYELCDEYGMLVADETNIETHGMGGQLSRDPSWGPIYLERCARLLLRDRNHPCVGIWSLGNESGLGANHAAMTGWLHDIDPTRPVQYECRNPGKNITDIICPMYPTMDWINSVLNDQNETRPFIMCEYAYAKGNATGNFFRFWDIVHSRRGFQGGFVWDWSDKSIYNVIKKTGKVNYGYGNDFGENYDYSYCGQHPTQVLNGIVDAAIKPHPGAEEMRVCQSPVRFTFADGVLTVINERNNATTEGLKLRWRVVKDGNIQQSGTQPLPVIETGKTGTMNLPVKTPSAPGEWFLDVFCDGPNHEINRAQFALAAPAAPVQNHLNGRAAEPVVSEKILKVGDFTWSRTDGRLISIQRNGVELLTAPVEEIFFRTPTCNDRWLDQGGTFAKDWIPLFHPERKLKSFNWSKNEYGQVVVTVETCVAVIDSKLVWTVAADGAIKFDQTASFRYDDLHSVARVGLIFPLVAGFEDVAYYGRGPHENYPDRQHSAIVGKWNTTVSNMLENYLVPTECGSRGEVRSMTLSGSPGKSISVYGAPWFRFSSLHFTPWDLKAAGHSWELTPRKETTLILDGFHMGLGGDTGWTINVYPEYQLRAKTYEWSCFLNFSGK